MQIHSYLFFDGNCEEALSFYLDILGGSIVTKMLYSEAPPGIDFPDHMSGKIMHAALESGDLALLACDSPDPLVVGNNVHLSISLDSMDEAAAVFKGLAENGSVTMPFEDAFWGGKFGMLTDRFGIHWMVSGPHEPE